MSASKIGDLIELNKIDDQTTHSTIFVEVHHGRRELLQLRLELEGEWIRQAALSGRGCTSLLRLIVSMRQIIDNELAKQIDLKVTQLPVFEGENHAEMLMRELILKARGEWRYPYEEEEVCHCRKIPTAKVDAAIVSGCRDLNSVRKATGANTSCGACRYDIEKMIEYRVCSQTRSQVGRSE